MNFIDTVEWFRAKLAKINTTTQRFALCFFLCAFASLREIKGSNEL